MFNENPQFFLAPPFGVPGGVQWGEISTGCLLDMPTNIVAGGMVVSTDYKLTYETAAMPGLDEGAQLTVGGALYRVRIAKPIDDGVFSEAEMTKL